MIYSDGSGLGGYVGAAAVMYKAGQSLKVLKLHLGTLEEHMTYEVEAAGLSLALHLLSTERDARLATTMLDNQSVIQLCYAPCRSRPGPEFGSVGFGVRADMASASGSLRRLVFPVRVLVAVKGLTRGATASRAEGQGGYECRVEIYFTAMLFDN